MKNFLLSLFLCLSIGSIVGYAQDYELVTDASQITVGNEYILVGTVKGEERAMSPHEVLYGTTGASTKTGSEKVTLNSDGTITLASGASVAHVVIQNAPNTLTNTAEFPYLLKVLKSEQQPNEYFLYEKPGSNHLRGITYLKAQDANFGFAVNISISGNSAIVLFNGEGTKNGSTQEICLDGTSFITKVPASTNVYPRLYKRMGPGTIKASIEGADYANEPLRSGTKVTFTADRSRGFVVNDNTVDNPYIYTVSFDGNSTTTAVTLNALPEANYPTAEGEIFNSATFSFPRFEAAAPSAITATVNGEAIEPGSDHYNELANGTIVTLYSENAGGLLVDGKTVSNPYNYAVNHPDYTGKPAKDQNYSISVTAIRDIDYLGDAEMPTATYTFGHAPAPECGKVVFNPEVDAIAKGVEISLSCENAVTIMYSIDGGKTYTEYTGPFTLDLTLVNNEITVWAYGINGDGEGSAANANEWKYQYIPFTKSGLVTFTADGKTLSGSAVTDLYPGDLIELNCDENAVKIEYSINGGDYTEYTEPIKYNKEYTSISARGVNEDGVAGETVTFTFAPLEFTHYDLVTSTDHLQDGAEYVIVSAAGYAIGGNLSGTNIPGTTQFVRDEENNYINVKAGSNIYRFTFQKTEEGKYNLYSADKSKFFNASDADFRISMLEPGFNTPTDYTITINNGIASISTGARKIKYQGGDTQAFRNASTSMTYTSDISIYRLIKTPEDITATIEGEQLTGYRAEVLTGSVITFASEGADYLMVNGEKQATPYEYTATWEGDDQTAKTVEITAHVHNQNIRADYTITRKAAVLCGEPKFIPANEVKVVEGKNLLDFGTKIAIECENAVKIMYSINGGEETEYTEPVTFDAERQDAAWTIKAYGINLDGKKGEETTETYYRGNADNCGTVAFMNGEEVLTDESALIKGTKITLTCEAAVTIKYQIDNEPAEGLDYDFENGIIFEKACTLTAWGINADGIAGEKASVTLAKEDAPLSGAVTFEPNGGAFYAGDVTIKLSCDENALRIMYSINGGEAQTYDPEAGIPFTTGGTIEAWGVNIDDAAGTHSTSGLFTLKEPVVYKRINSVNEIAPEGKYILVTTYGVGIGSYDLNAKVFSAATEGIELSEDKSMASIRDNADINVLTFKAADNGFKIMDSTTSGYMFSNTSSNNLNSGATEANATTFTLAFKADGTVDISNGANILYYNTLVNPAVFRFLNGYRAGYQQFSLYRVLDESAAVPAELYIHGCFYDGEWERSIEMVRNDNVFTAKDIRIATNGRGHQYILATFAYGDVEDPFGSTTEDDNVYSVRRKAVVLTTAVPSKVWSGEKSQANVADKIYVPQADGTATTYTVGDLKEDSQIKPADALERNARHDITADFSNPFSPVFTVEKSGITTGVDEIDADNSDAPVEYFNLQGIRVENPETGYYIRRQGSSTSKVYIIR